MAALKLFFLICFSFFSNSYSEVYKDSYGNSIEIKKTPQKIIAIGPGAARLVAYLDAVDKLAATENIEIKFPQGRPYSVAYKEVFKKLPVISEGGPDKIPDYEKIIAISPDLIIICSVDASLSKSIASKTKIPVFNADYGNLGTFETNRFKQVIQTLGKILGKEKRALWLSKRIDFYVQDLKKRVKGNKNPSIYVGGLGFKGSHGITSTQYSYEPFNLLGLKSVIDRGFERRHIFIEKEKLASLNPEYIFLDLGGIEIFLQDYASNPKFYDMLLAFSKGNVYTTLPYNYYTTNVEIVFANAYFIGKVLFPEKFKDIDINKKAAEIIKDFVGKDVYNDFMTDKRFYKKLLKKENGIYFE